jgi:hypothetical protein
MQFQHIISSLIEKEKGCYIEDCYNCSQVVHGLEQVSVHFQRTSSVMEELVNVNNINYLLIRIHVYHLTRAFNTGKFYS